MKRLVLKFGGSSLSDNKKLKMVANKIINYKKKNFDIIVVVSAQGKTTDKLINEIKELENVCNNKGKNDMEEKDSDTKNVKETKKIKAKNNLQIKNENEKDNDIYNDNSIYSNQKMLDRELDSLLSTGEQMSASKLAFLLNKMNFSTISLNAFQIKINTDSNYQNSKILNIDKSRIEKELENNNIVIVTGFQGIDKYNNITTLGRDGSDYTAIALAKTFNTEKCILFKDVDGVYDLDPNVVKSAKRIKKIGYDDMINLSKNGANVIQTKSVEIAKKYNVVIEVKSTFKNNGGTIIEA